MDRASESTFFLVDLSWGYNTNSCSFLGKPKSDPLKDYYSPSSRFRYYARWVRMLGL